MTDLTPAPTFRALAVVETPTGLTIAPRRAAPSYWIEAAVWFAAAIGCAALYTFGGSTARIIAAVVIVGVTVRALITIVKAALGGSLRRLNVTETLLAGPFVKVARADVKSLEVRRIGGDTYLQAITHAGAEHTLLDLDPANADDYRALAAWLVARATS